MYEMQNPYVRKSNHCLGVIFTIIYSTFVYKCSQQRIYRWSNGKRQSQDPNRGECTALQGLPLTLELVEPVHQTSDGPGTELGDYSLGQVQVQCLTHARKNMEFLFWSSKFSSQGSHHTPLKMLHLNPHN